MRACSVSGSSTMMMSASRTASAVVRTRSPASSAFAHELDPSRTPPRTSPPAPPRVGGVGGALGAVAEYRDLAPVEEREVGVGVVVDGRGHGEILFVSCSGVTFPALSPEKWRQNGLGKGRSCWY